MARAEQLTGVADSLLDYLGTCKYPIGVDHYLRVHRLLTSLAARGELPPSSKDLEHWVRPLVCQSAREQDRFDRDFADWLRSRGEAPVETVPAVEPVEQTLRVVKRGRRLYLWMGAAVLGTAILAALLWYARLAAFSPSVPDRQPARGPAGTSLPVYPILGLAILAVVLLISYLRWRRARVTAFLVQREAKAPASTAALFVERADPLIYNGLLLSAAARGFGIYRRVASQSLNIGASAAATAREGGRFTPVYAERPAVPEYLVLIDRSSSADLFAGYASGIVHRLEESNVAVDQFDFDRVPRQCYAKRGHRPVGIRELTERFPDHRVLVFSDGAGFLESAGISYAPWMEPFAGWEFKILITPNPRAYWGPAETAITGAGWTVISADQAELAALAHDLTPDEPEPGFVPGMFGSVAATGRRWLRRAVPPQSEVEELLADLRVSLGEAGFYWLCACAAYPAIDWNVTLYLGRNLTGTNGRPLLTERAFLALSRLPWFRHGRMPEWLRIHLLGKLSRPQEQDVRTALQMLLNSAASGPVNTYRLEVDKELRGSLSALTRGLLSRLRKSAPSESPIQDRVFVEFLSGRNPALAVPLPPWISDALRKSSSPGAPGGWLGHPKRVWQLLALALLAETAVQSTPFTGPNAVIGLAMLGAGFLASRWLSIEQITSIGFTILCLAALGNIFTSNLTPFGLGQIGLGLIWPGLAVLLARQTDLYYDSRLSAFLLWTATVSIPALIPTPILTSVWIKVLVLVLIPVFLQFIGAFEQIYGGVNQQFMGVAVIAAAALALTTRMAPNWVLPALLAFVSFYAAGRLSWHLAASDRAAVFWAGFTYSLIGVLGFHRFLPNATFGVLVFNASVVATAVFLSLALRKEPRFQPTVGAFGVGFVGEWFGFGPVAANSPVNKISLAIVAVGEPVVDAVGTELAMRNMPAELVVLAVALWWALRELGISVGQFSMSDAFADYAAAAALVCGAAMIWIGWRSSATGGKPRIVAALCYALVGLPSLLIRSYRRNTFVRFHAAQAVSLWALWLAMASVKALVPFLLALLRKLGFPVQTIPLLYTIPLTISLWAPLALMVAMLVQALRGKMTRLPLIGQPAMRFAYRVTRPAEQPATAALST